LLAEVSHCVILPGRKEVPEILVINPSILGQAIFLPFLLEISANV